MRAWLSAGLAVGLLGSAVAAQTAAPIAGEIAAVRVWAYGTPPDSGERRDLFLSDSVFVRERLETVSDGALHVRLADDTMLRLGSASVVILDEFIYRPEADSWSLLASVGKGVCRFITGKAAQKELIVRTASATIAARGTEFSVWVFEDGSTTVWVQDGEVEVTPADGSPSARVGSGEIVSAPIAGGVLLDAPRPAADPGIGPTPRVLIPRRKQNR